MRLAIRLLAIALAVIVPALIAAQAPPNEQTDTAIDAVKRSKVVESALAKLKESYVFPEKAVAMEDAIKKRIAAGEYDQVTSSTALAKKLTEDLQAVSHDKHLRVRYSYREIPEQKNDEPSPAQLERMKEYAKHANYGFEKVERLAGNVGYLDFRVFMNPSLAGETAATAMNFLSNSGAMIIDLRKNGGGDPAMVALICSYLFEADPVHLNDIYSRPTDTTRQFWTLPYLPGKRFTGKPVYVLTSKRTFSGAEECAYNLKNLKRATIVGETTGGGAHPGGMIRIDPHFGIFVPTGRAINPITKTNWEGTGVTPDIAATADEALKVAHRLALKTLLSTAKDPDYIADLNDALASLGKETTDQKANSTAAKP